MARPNLSLEHLALTLAALGTSAVITACAKSEPAGAVRSDQAPATASAAAPVAPEQTPQAIATTTATAAPSAAASAAPPAPAKRAKDRSGQASCGAGTCTAEMKKK